MSKDLSALTEALLDAAKKAGAEAADVMALDGASMTMEVRGGALEQAVRSEGTEIGMRVFIGQRSASVSSSDIRPDTIATMAERAVAMAREAPEDPFIGLADAEDLSPIRDADALELCENAPEPDPTDLEDHARRAEAAARANPAITQIDSATGGYYRHTTHLATSNGFSGGYTRSGHSLSCVAIAGSGSGMERDYDQDSRVFTADMRSPEDIGTSAAERTCARLNARRPQTGAYPVLFDERVASSLIGHLLSAINGASVARGASWLRDAMGAQILPDHLSLHEDPHRPRAFSSRPFDGEGLRTRPRAIIDRGTLTGWTLDLASARKLGMHSTANAARGIGGSPSPSVWNIELTQGPQSRDDLIADMGTGLVVTSMIGSTINPNTGDYSRGAAGFWVENGQIAYPVSGVTIAGNLRDMLRTIVPANDARPWLSRVVPSLLVQGLTLAGD